MDQLRDWLIFISGILVWAFTLGAVWTRLNAKVDTAIRDAQAERKDIKEELAEKATTHDVDGLGGRMKILEADCSVRDGRMDRIEKELSEYRRDAQEASKTVARVEKGVEDVHESIQHGNLQLGSQLHGIEKLIQEKDLKVQTRLTRIETVQSIEKKIGPLPID